MKEIVKLERVTKKFPGVIALNNVQFSLEEGSVHALMGENGAGKSTLIKILSGTYSDYVGKMFLNGNEVRFANEGEAIEAGISVVPQELQPIDDLTIAENIFIGREPSGRIPFFIDRKKRNELTCELLKEFELDCEPQTLMGKLSVAQKQMIEIIKAISKSSKVIIMDEPTSALTNIETQHLFEQISLLKKKGISIIFISHKLEEVYKVCDTVTVLRDGNYIDTKKITEVSEEDLIAMMVGRKVSDIYPLIESAQNETVMAVRNLTSKGVFENVSFELHKGEILGFAGMMGAGRSEIMRTIFGMERYTSGEILLEDKRVSIRCPGDAIKAGIAMIMEDRATYGFVGIRSIADNVGLANGEIYAPYGWVLKNKLQEDTRQICERLRVKAQDIHTLVGTLSGGNQQKVVLSKWLVRNVKILIMDEPTRGIDVGAKQEIYRLIKELAAEGMAILLVSSEMPEVLSMSHRVEVVADGKIVGEVSGDDATQDNVMKMIAGGKGNE